MYLDVFQAEQDYAAYRHELDEIAAELKLEHMLKSEGTLSKWILGLDVGTIPEVVSLIAIVTNATAYRIYFEYGPQCEERWHLLLGVLGQTQPRIWSDNYDRITYAGAELLEFFLSNYKDISFKNGREEEESELFETCAAIEDRIVDLLIAEEYEDD